MVVRNMKRVLKKGRSYFSSIKEREEKSKQIVKTIQESSYFNAEWYKNTYLKNINADPAEHYLYYGARLGYDPSMEFSSFLYLENYPDVKESGTNPLVHYELWGRTECRRVFDSQINWVKRSIFFDEVWYKNTYLNGQDVDAAVHYTTEGAKNGNEPSPFFSSNLYKTTGSFEPTNEANRTKIIEQSAHPDAPLYDFEIVGRKNDRYFSDYNSIMDFLKQKRLSKISKVEIKEELPDIKVYVACNADSYVPENKLFFPIQTGSALASKHFDGMLYDDEGDNISALNPHYCELTAQYWVWKNKKSDYVGFFHNRRYLSFSDEIYPTSPYQLVNIGAIDDSAIEQFELNEGKMSQLITDYDIIVPEKVDMNKVSSFYPATLDQQFNCAPGLVKKDMDKAISVLHELHPEYDEDAKEYMSGNYGYFLNMYIMKWEHFNNYCNWLFPILQAVNENADYENRNNYELRTIGMVSERLFGIYYTHLLNQQKVKTRELQCVFFTSIEEPVVKPVFTENTVAIAFSCSNLYAPMLGVTIRSIIENSNDSINYDLIVLNDSLTFVNKERLMRLVNGRKNFSLRFHNIGKVLSDAEINSKNHISTLSYARLMLPSILKDYNKVIYLDCDLIMNADIAELFNLDIGDNLIAAVYDLNVIGWSKVKYMHQAEYNKIILNMDDPYQYFNAGSIVMNLEELRKKYCWEDMINLIKSQNWRWMDQDILNAMCYGRVKFIDMKWNTTVAPFVTPNELPAFFAPSQFQSDYKKALKNPKVIHFAGHHTPCFDSSVQFSELYWEIAKKTDFYESLLTINNFN